jgi:hypothetical protein
MIIALGLIVILTGCSSPRTEAEKQREAFRLSHVPHSHRSTFLSANSLVSDGDHYYFEAMAMPELKHRSSLLHKAAAKYRKAILMMRDILPEVEDPTDKKYINDAISHTEASLEETVRALPIFEQ